MKKFSVASIYLPLIFIFCVSFTFPTFAKEIAPADIFLKRHSYKAYDPTRYVTREQMAALVEAARWAPSSHNAQPWNFIFCDKQTNPEAYRKVLDALKESQQKWAQNASLLVIIVTRVKDMKEGKNDEWADYDTGAAAVCMALQASELGLMAHQIGGFDHDKIRKSFRLPQYYQARTLMIIGAEPLEGDPKAKVRIRKPVHENFFSGEWGSGLEL